MLLLSWEGTYSMELPKGKRDLKNLKGLQEKLGKVKLDEEGDSSNVAQQEIYGEEIFLLNVKRRRWVKRNGY